MAAAHKKRVATSPSSSSAPGQPGHTAPRKVVPIKHPDGQPLTRADLQFDFLNAVFADSHAVFTNPYAPSSVNESDNISRTKITFRDLYVNSILHSPKATKVLKDKMTESAIFAVDFAMLALLVNVGRVNTTMSFFPGMKTTIRTYHPIPALSRSDGNLQDAPRIKHVLKSSLLATDAKSTPATPGDILVRHKAGKRPSTGVTNLIFVLAHHSGPVGQTHFEGQINFLDLFLRTDTSSESRARIFLWLCYNYLEAPSLPPESSERDTNPFSDAKKFVPPPLTLLTPEEMALENRETEEDMAVTDRLLSERNRVVVSQSVKEAMKESAAKASMNGSVVGDEDDDAAVSAVGEEVVKGKGKAKKGATSTAVTVAASHAKGKGKRVIPPTTTSSKEKKVALTVEKSKTRPPAAMLIPDLDEEDKIDAFIKQRPASVGHFGSEPFQHPSALFSTVPSQLMSRVASDSRSHLSHTRYSPYARHSPSSVSSASDTRPRPRTMFQQAWHVITSTDPLVDSDNESGGDEYVRDDYLQRLEVIERFSQQPWSQQQPQPQPQQPPHPSKIETES